MSEYQVTDYGILSNAVTSTKNYVTSINDAQTVVTECNTILSDGTMFMGPIQENCMQEMATLDTDVKSIVSNFETISNYIITTGESYQAGDKEAAETVLTMTDGKLTTTSAITNSKMSIPADPEIAAKKQAWLGDVDDPNNYTEYTGNNLFRRHNELELFDNTTGEIIQDHGTITMKPGETRIITVKLPTDTGMIQEIRRTSADGDERYRSGKIVTAKSDIDPDPNNIEYVRLVENGKYSYHAPSDMSLLHNNSYDWIFTANSKGKVQASQTCLWSSSMTNGRNLKAMINLNVEVKDDDNN